MGSEKGDVVDTRKGDVVDPISKVKDWLRKNETEHTVEESVISETYTEKEERFKYEKIKQDRLYKSYKQYCVYSVLKKKVVNNFRRLDKKI